VTRLLELQSVRAAYGEIEVVHGIDLTVDAGQVVALLGPNGAGKTTLVKVASGLMQPRSGKVLLAGRDVTGMSAAALAKIGLCTIPEGRGVFPNLSVRENLVMATYGGPSLSDIEERAYSRFPRLAERRNQLAGTMSGGEQQMLALARGLATDPAVLMLDELSMGLAPKIVQQLYEQVASIAAEGIGVLVVEQFARVVLGVADWAVLVAHGVVINSGSPVDIEKELESAYLGGA
jgi:branched-chain amino acid transport system ATP-binding protein